MSAPVTGSPDDAGAVAEAPPAAATAGRVAAAVAGGGETVSPTDGGDPGELPGDSTGVHPV